MSTPQASFAHPANAPSGAPPRIPGGLDPHPSNIGFEGPGFRPVPKRLRPKRGWRLERAGFWSSKHKTICTYSTLARAEAAAAKLPWYRKLLADIRVRG